MEPCSACHGTRVVAVEVCDEPQARTCLACPKPAPVAAREGVAYVPRFAPEAGTADQHRLGLRDAVGGRGW